MLHSTKPRPSRLDCFSLHSRRGGLEPAGVGQCVEVMRWLKAKRHFVVSRAKGGGKLG